MEDFEIVDSKEIQCYYEQSELAGLFLGRDYEAARRAIMTEYKLNMWACRMSELMEDAMEEKLFMQWLREGLYDGPNRNLDETELYKQLTDKNKEFFDRFSGRALFSYQKVHLLLALLKRQEKEKEEDDGHRNN